MESRRRAFDFFNISSKHAKLVEWDLACKHNSQTDLKFYSLILLYIKRIQKNQNQKYKKIPTGRTGLVLRVDYCPPPLSRNHPSSRAYSYIASHLSIKQNDIANCVPIVRKFGPSPLLFLLCSASCIPLPTTSYRQFNPCSCVYIIPLSSTARSVLDPEWQWKIHC